MKFLEDQKIMIDIFEVDDLVQYIYEKAENKEPNLNEFDSDTYLTERYGIDFITFSAIVADLIDFTPLLKSPLTGTLSHCFGVIENKDTGLFRAIVKKIYD